MTTQPDPTTDNTPDGEMEVTVDGYKELQRKLNKANERAKRATRERLESERLRAEQEIVTTSVTDLIAAIRDGMDEDKIEEIEEGIERKRRSIAEQSSFISEIDDALADTDFDWDTSEELDKAREAWEAGDFSRAVREVAAVVRPASEADLQARIQEGLQKELARLGLKVDTGESSAVAGSTPKTLAEAARMRVEGKLTDDEYREVRRSL